MMSMEEALERLGYVPDRSTLEMYIARAWIRPAQHEQTSCFEEIDLARVQLVYHLQKHLRINEDAMDVVLHLLDQVYGLREQMRYLHHALERQPQTVRSEIVALLREAGESSAT